METTIKAKTIEKVEATKEATEETEASAKKRRSRRLLKEVMGIPPI
jgi:hypothetical protein